MPRYALIIICKTILPIFDFGSIVCDNCSDGDKQMLKMVQLFTNKGLLGCFSTASSKDVPTDFNHLR